MQFIGLQFRAYRKKIIRSMPRIIESIGGVGALVVLALKTRLRLRGRYWRWRYETAFGSDPDKHTTRRARFRAMLDYGRWVYRMRRAR